jgi:outer membrane protein TolC
MRRLPKCGVCSTCALTLALTWGAAASAQPLDLRIPTRAALGFQPGPAGQPVTGTLTLEEAIQRGLEYNLNVIDARYNVKSAQGQRRVSRAALLPNLLADMQETWQTVNLQAFGFRFESPIAGFDFPSVVGPFSLFDLRARLSQTVFDRSALNSHRAASESARAAEFSAQDARDIVVMAVGGSYLQALAARARVDSGRAQLETASALLKQAQQRRGVGLVAQVDVDRAEVQALIQQQRLIALQNDFAKLKIDLARLIGAQPTDQFSLPDDLPFVPAPTLDTNTALQQARDQRADLKAAVTEVRAAERELSASRDAYLPTVNVNADFGTIGPNPSEARRTFAVVGQVRVPLWQGGRTEGQVEQAEATLARRQAALEDLSRVVEGEIRKAMFDVEAFAAQVGVNERNLQVSRETLELTRQRFEAGVSGNIEVVQAQDSVSAAAFEYINSVFSHNLAKLNLARSLGNTEVRIREYLRR